jgi:hypothetical protein
MVGYLQPPSVIYQPGQQRTHQVVPAGSSTQLPAETSASFRTTFLFLACFFCKPVQFIFSMVRLLGPIKRPLSASPSINPSLEPPRDFGHFFTASEDPAAEHTNAVREDQGSFVKGSPNTSCPTNPGGARWLIKFFRDLCSIPF